ncbi:hypothetical protein K438DRAFT_1995601 [Mycena galopus ATCC 62051]|nr:hypothetical protein K438DRAFT_1995601 [Mycena galopus ATCC 62051]
MALSSRFTTLDLSGQFVLNFTLSDNYEEMLEQQGDLGSLGIADDLKYWTGGNAHNMGISILSTLFLRKGWTAATRKHGVLQYKFSPDATQNSNKQSWSVVEAFSNFILNSHLAIMTGLKRAAETMSLINRVHFEFGRRDRAYAAPAPHTYMSSSPTKNTAAALMAHRRARTLHDAHEAKRGSRGETREEFEGLDTSRAKGKLGALRKPGILRHAWRSGRSRRAKRWVFALFLSSCLLETTQLATGEQFTKADAAAEDPTQPSTSIYIVYSWQDYYGDSGAHAFGGVVLRPAPSRTSPQEVRDGVLVRRTASKRGRARRMWALRSAGSCGTGRRSREEERPARKKAKTDT